MTIIFTAVFERLLIIIPSQKYICASKDFNRESMVSGSSIIIKRKKEGIVQESIQSSTTPDPRYHMGKCEKHTQENTIYKGAEKSAIS